MNTTGGLDPRFIQARSALLDVLSALGLHRQAVVLVGAQAVYLRVGEAQTALSSFTNDADLALNPERLATRPAIEDVLASAGYQRRNQPGLWFNASGIEVDLLVPASMAGRGSRAADLGDSHDRMAAMRVLGLEAALVEHSTLVVAALDPADDRSFTIAVAGPAALLVSKLYKVGERTGGTPDRLKNKDASDIYLLLQRTRTADITARLRELSADPIINSTIDTALGYLQEGFGQPEGYGLTMLREALSGLEDADAVESDVLSCMVLAQDLLAAY